MSDLKEWFQGDCYQVLIDHMQDGLFAVVDRQVVFANPRLQQMLGYDEAQLTSMTFDQVIHPEDLPIVAGRYEARRKGLPVPSHYEARLCRSDGAVLDIHMSVGVIKGPEGQLVTVGTAKDITEQKRAFEAVRHSQKELSSILDSLPDVFYRADMNGIITMMSPASFEAIGYLPEEMIGRPMAEFYADPKEREKVAQAIVEGGGRAKQVEAAMRHKDGRAIWVSTNAFVRLDDLGNPLFVEGVARDISERKQMEDELNRLATTDDLTGLYNRRHFFGKAEQVVHVTKRYGRPLTALMLDLDHFKGINDRYGHHVGDKALKAFASTCRTLVRDADIFGRLGGEEFGLVLPETDAQQARVLAERIRACVETHQMETADQPLRFTVSIGLVGLDEKHDNLEHLLGHADQALYQAKAAGRNRVVSF